MLKQYLSVFALVCSLVATGVSEAATVSVEDHQYQALSSPFTVFSVTASQSKIDTQKSFSTSQGETAISAVPVPAAAWLFLSGLVGLLTVSRRKKDAAKA